MSDRPTKQGWGVFSEFRAFEQKVIEFDDATYRLHRANQDRIVELERWQKEAVIALRAAAELAPGPLNLANHDRLIRQAEGGQR